MLARNRAAKTVGIDIRNSLIGMPQSVLANEFVQEIETSLRGASEEKRQDVLRRVTELFLGRMSTYSEADARVFDDVLQQLITHVETCALAELSARLAQAERAPPQVMRDLARSDSIEVAGPVLAGAAGLDDVDLIDIASTKSQAHLVHIAQRREISEAVTDVLVDRGDADVASTVAGNMGARLSDMSMAKLVLRADGDARLTGAMAQRRDIPAALFNDLVTQATDAVRARLLTLASPENRGMIQDVLDRIAAQAGKKKGLSPIESEARRMAALFSQDHDMTRSQLVRFATGRQVTEMVAALSALSGLNVSCVQRLFQSASCFGLLALTRAIMVEWNTAWAVLTAAPFGFDVDDSPFSDLRTQYEALSPASARRLMGYWQSRQIAAAQSDAA
ncbi:MAG: DUF2336 domain-containing protein [Pseudolabrys sp.]